MPLRERQKAKGKKQKVKTIKSFSCFVYVLTLMRSGTVFKHESPINQT